MMLLPEPSDHLRVIAIVEAYANTSENRGNALELHAGQPMLGHVLEQLRQSQFIERIAVVTSVDPADQAVVAFALDHDAIAIRGPDHDLLLRFARIAELLDADIVVRVAADASPVDAGFVDHLVAALIEQDGDYAMPDGASRGICPFTRRALDKLMMDAHDDNVARTRVTDYFDLHPEFARAARPLPYLETAVQQDSPATGDVAFVDSVRARMAARGGEATLSDLLLLRAHHPRLRRRAIRASTTDSHSTVLIHCAGDDSSYGHTMRMLSLARTLKDKHGLPVHFAVTDTPEMLGRIRQAGFEAEAVGAGRDEVVLSKTVAATAPRILILDRSERMSRNALARLSRHVTLTAVIEDRTERRLAADLAYYPPLPQTVALDWTDSHCTARIGWEWVFLGSVNVGVPRRTPVTRPTVLVTMTGRDSETQLLHAARGLASLAPVFRARFVIGSGMKNGATVARKILNLATHFETLEGAEDLATDYTTCDLAMTDFGLAAFELAASGVPAIYLCQSEDAVLSAQAFERAGVGRSLGLAARLPDGQVGRAAWGLLADAQGRRQMRLAGPAIIDGQGATRLADDLVMALASRRVAETRRAVQ